MLQQEFIKIGEKFYRKHNIVMLPSEKSKIYFTVGDEAKKLNFNPKITFAHSDKYIQPQHLYLFSEEEIKEGDWYLYIDNAPVVIKCSDTSFINIPNVTKGKCFKIIASTDRSLNLPGFSNDFIKSYCEQGRIDEVLVEYIPHIIFRKDGCPFYLKKNGLYQAKDEHGVETLHIKDCVDIGDCKLKVASDNTIFATNSIPKQKKTQKNTLHSFNKVFLSHVYELTWSNKLNKKEILNIEVLFDRVLAIDVKDVGILIFENQQLESKTEKGASYYFLRPQGVLNWIKTNQHTKISLLKRNKKSIVEELEKINKELEFYEVEVQNIIEELNKEKQELYEKISSAFKTQNKK